MPETREPAAAPLRLGAVAEVWWPLAASWLLMGCELPVVSAVMARLPQATLSLAAYGGFVFPLSLLIESPIIMLLSASTALCRDAQSYRLVRRFMLAGGGGLSALHALVAFSPLFDLLVGGVMHAPREVLEPARLGLRVMTPWSLSIAYRRMQQGVLIRNGRSHAVGIGTGVRLGANALVLAAGYLVGLGPGILVGTLAVAAGVVSEAVYAGLAVRGVLRERVWSAPPAPEPLGPAKFLHFYVPLALTPLIMFISNPLASALMSRMPRALDSLAAWPVVNGLVFTLRSLGFAFNEVVVAMLDRPGAPQALRRFGVTLAAATSLGLLVVAATPLAWLWFVKVSALPATLAELAGLALWMAVPMPALSALQSLWQGTLVHQHRTRGVTESTVVFLAAAAAGLLVGQRAGTAPGLQVTLAAISAATGVQVAWLAWRARGPKSQAGASELA